MCFKLILFNDLLIRMLNAAYLSAAAAYRRGVSFSRLSNHKLRLGATPSAGSSPCLVPDSTRFGGGRWNRGECELVKIYIVNIEFKFIETLQISNFDEMITLCTLNIARLVRKGFLSPPVVPDNLLFSFWSDQRSCGSLPIS